jgi:hypothetical protein
LVNSKSAPKEKMIAATAMAANNAIQFIRNPVADV